MRFFYLFFLLLLFSCQGYRFRYSDDHFLPSYGIRSISFLTFFNHSLFPEATTPCMTGVHRALTGLGGIKVLRGESESADSVLIGIISGPEKINKAIIPAEVARVKVLGDKREYQLSPSQSITLSLRIVLIKKRGYKQEIKEILNSVLLSEKEIVTAGENESNLGHLVSPEIIFDHKIPLNFSYTLLQSAASETVFSRQKGIELVAIEKLMAHVQDQFTQLVLYAF